MKHVVICTNLYIFNTLKIEPNSIHINLFHNIPHLQFIPLAPATHLVYTARDSVGHNCCVLPP